MMLCLLAFFVSLWHCWWHSRAALAFLPSFRHRYFVVIWGAFAASLFYLNRVYGRKVYLVLDPPHLPAIWADATIWGPYSTVPGSWGSYVAFNWKAATLIATGFMGGIFSSISGSGIDICSFAILTLLFRISEKTATPTSVLLMSINTIVGFLFRQFGQGGVETNAWGFLLVCAPIVCFGAPFGSVIGSFVHRLVLAWCIYITDAVQLIAAIVIVEPWVKNDAKPGKDTPVHLTASSIAIFCSGLVFFYILQVHSYGNVSEYFCANHGEFLFLRRRSTLCMPAWCSSIIL